MTKFKALIIGVVVALIVLLIVILSYTRIHAGYVGVVYNANSGIQQEVLTEGRKFISPFDKVTEFPISREMVSWSAKTDEGKDATDTSIKIGSLEGKQMTVDITIAVSCKPDQAPNIYKTYRGQDFDVLKEIVIRPIVKATVNQISKEYATFDIYSTKTQEIADRTEAIVAEKLDVLGFTVYDFNITDVNLDEQTKTSLDNIQRIKLEKAQAEATAENNKIVAGGKAQALIIESQGKADALIIQAQSEAKANALVSSSLTDSLIRYNEVEKWNGSKATTVMNGTATPIVNAQ